MNTQFLFDPVWKSRYVQMLVSCGVDKEAAVILARSLWLIEDVTTNDVCNLTPDQATNARITIKETYPDHYEAVMSRLNDYIEWRKLFEPYMGQPLQREEILNSKEMREIVDVPLTPDDLEAIIVTALGEKTINIAAPCLCLAWMGYETSDMAQLKESDVDFDAHMIRNIRVPDPLWRVLYRYYNTDSEKVPNKGSGRWIYKIHGEWLIKSTDSRLKTTTCKVDPKKITVSITNASKKYRQIAGRSRQITVRSTKVAGMLYRLYEPWDAFTDEQCIEALRFKKRTYDTYHMQSWKQKFTAYCLLRETREAT